MLPAAPEFSNLAPPRLAKPCCSRLGLTASSDAGQAIAARRAPLGLSMRALRPASPFQCQLFASRVFSSPAKIPVSLTPALCIEHEITFRLLADLPPRVKLYRPEEVANVVEACPSMEVVDRPIPAGRGDGKPTAARPRHKGRSGRGHGFVQRLLPRGGRSGDRRGFRGRGTGHRDVREITIRA
jgi:hypothetical protein